MKKLLEMMDINDRLIVGGMALLAIGLAAASLPLAIGVVGGLLLAIGLVGAWRKAR